MKLCGKSRAENVESEKKDEPALQVHCALPSMGCPLRGRELAHVGADLTARCPRPVTCLLPRKEASLGNKMSCMELFLSQAGPCLRRFDRMSHFN